MKNSKHDLFFHDICAFQCNILSYLLARSWIGSVKLNPGIFLTLVVVKLQSSSMDDAGISKLTGIKQIARLKEIFHKWQTATMGTKDDNDNNNHTSDVNHHGGISPMINKRLTNLVYCDSDEDSSCNSPQPPHDVPKGYLAVYVGPELRRFIIPTSYLSHSLFKLLLEKAAEEFGFDQSGGLTIPCEIETFKYLLNCMENHQQHHDDDSSCKLIIYITWYHFTLNSVYLLCSFSI